MSAKSEPKFGFCINLANFVKFEESMKNLEIFLKYNTV